MHYIGVGNGAVASLLSHMCLRIKEAEHSIKRRTLLLVNPLVKYTSFREV